MSRSNATLILAVTSLLAIIGAIFLCQPTQVNPPRSQREPWNPPQGESMRSNETRGAP